MGASWSAASAEAGWSVAGLKKWIRDHPQIWARELGRFRRENQEAAGDEAVAVLRKQLRATEAKTVLQAAVVLAGRFAPRRGPVRKADAKDSSNMEELLEDDKWIKAIEAVEAEGALPSEAGASEAG
ncbi:MAG: hypothetical protein ACJ8C4_00355 [Gemmataceae bacterium]